MRMNVNHLFKHPCNKDWLVALIWMINANQIIFSKDFVPDKKKGRLVPKT